MAGLTVGVVGASGAAGAFNQYYERELDRGMPAEVAELIRWPSAISA